MLVMPNMLIHYRHLSTTDARANITHTVIIADFLMLVIRVGFSGLCGKKHDAVLRFLIRAYQSPATRSGDHLVAIKTQHAIMTEGTQHLAIVS